MRGGRSSITAETASCHTPTASPVSSFQTNPNMKFGKNIARVVELSDPEWSPFWINYKFLKKKAKVRACLFELTHSENTVRTFMQQSVSAAAEPGAITFCVVFGCAS